MKLLRSIALAFSMFSRLPVPKVDWNEENMRYMICALPPVSYTHLDVYKRQTLDREALSSPALALPRSENACPDCLPVP